MAGKPRKKPSNNNAGRSKRYFIPFEEHPAAYDYDYPRVIDDLNRWTDEEAVEPYQALLRDIGKTSIFGLAYLILGITQINQPWLVERCNEVQANHDRTLDLWFREGWKSSLLSFLLPIQQILNDPETSIVIFSHTRALAKAFLRRIKQTLETATFLQLLFPDVLYSEPKSQSPKWSEDEGLICKRRGTFAEATLEAWGVTDGMPTGKHYKIRVYDDLVTRDSVQTPEQIAKTKECFELSHNLGRRGGEMRVIGTRYHFGDLYSSLIESGSWHTRIYPAEDASSKNPVFLTAEELAQKRVDMGPFVYAAQMLLNPIAEENQVFSPEWLQYYHVVPSSLNIYILVDPASSKKTGSDYTAMAAVGIDPRGNHFLLDLDRRRLSLSERWVALREMVDKWPEVKRVGYERYGMMGDIEYIVEKQEETGYYFPVIELGGSMAKEDRIKRLQPLFADMRWWLPAVGIKRGKRDVLAEFLQEEYLFFPYSVHDDMLDAMSRVRDDALKPEFPLDVLDVEALAV